MIKLKVIVLVFSVVFITQPLLALTGIPDMSECEVSIAYTGPGTPSLMNVPNGEGNPFTEATDEEGNVVDATITPEAALNLRIAVIDSGIAPHRGLRSTNGAGSAGSYVTHHLDFVDRAKSPKIRPHGRDAFGHGTHVAGIIASQGLEYRGISYDVSLMAAKVLSSTGSGYASDVILGINWCVAEGADVINLSLGEGL